MAYLYNFAVLLVLLVFSAFFSGSETAIFSLSRLEKQRLSNRAPENARILKSLLKTPQKTLIAILIGNMVVNIMASSVAAVISVNIFGETGVPIAIVCFTVILLFFGEMTPKVISVRNSEGITSLIAKPLNFFIQIARPAIVAIRWISEKILRILLGKDWQMERKMTQEDLRGLIRLAGETGSLNKEERQRIIKLVSLEGKLAKEIMTPRTDISIFDLDDGYEKLIEIIKRSHRSFIPVCKGTVDNIEGVISTREFMLNANEAVRQFIKPVYFVPETKRVDDLIFDFKKRGISYAVCVDEYGGMSGVVTLEDALEEVFGEIYDEYDQEEPKYVKLSNNEWIVDASLSLIDFNDVTGFKVFSEKADTVGGFIFLLLGRVPVEHEKVVFDNIAFFIEKTVKNRIVRVRVKKQK